MLVCLACYGDRVAALLESASELRFYRAEPGGPPAVEARARVRLPAPVAELGLPVLIEVLTSAGAGGLVCGGLTGCALEALARSGLRVVPWVGGTAEEVAQAWSAGRITTMKMPGCAGCGRKWRSRGADGSAQRAFQRHKENRTMTQTRIAVTSEGPKMTDMVDPRFGRAAGFVVLDLETNAASYIDNGGSQALAQGAGIQAAENVARAGAGVVLSGFVGPKAFQALSAAGIQVVQNVENMTVGQAVDKFRQGLLAVADAPNAPAGGHPGGGRKG